MVGSRPHASWGAMVAGPARSLADWRQFRALSTEVQEQTLSGMRGSQQMIQDIEEAIPESWTEPLFGSAPIWMGAFSRLEILIGVQGCSGDRVWFFEAGSFGRLQQVEEESSLILSCGFQRIRVVGFRERQWLVDPDPATAVRGSAWRLWAWEGHPTHRLQWDPGEWRWRDPFAPPRSPEIPFFQYTARLGRRILTARIRKRPAAAEYWQRQGLSESFLTRFWQRTWQSHTARRVSTFVRLVAHSATAVGVWRARGGDDQACVSCGQQ